MSRRLAQIPVAHRDDPETSHEAAAAITDSGVRQTQAERVFRLVVLYPGMTSGELTALQVVRRYDRYQVSRRLADLKNLGKVRQGDSRVCQIMGTRQVTWWLVQGAEQLGLNI